MNPRRAAAAALATVAMLAAATGQYHGAVVTRIDGQPVAATNLPLNPPSHGLPWITGW